MAEKIVLMLTHLGGRDYRVTRRCGETVISKSPNPLRAAASALLTDRAANPDTVLLFVGSANQPAILPRPAKDFLKEDVQLHHALEQEIAQRQRRSRT
ncbi:hypothetical protein [Rhodoblastus sp.]|uniref:hypothetical protein n=1 Tax=Rhodoblastus sp. TaxID=1962975 RepID=UPI0025CD1406|nr:hypothetical protein [Rhodoblastus sp.]